MKPILLCLLIVSLASGRENPFFPASASQSEAVTSNIPDARPPLERVASPLPDQARVLKQITLTIQNLDGSTQTQQIEVDRSIDWHRPIVITQGEANTPMGDSSVREASSSSATLGTLSFHTKGKRLNIVSPYPVLRHFALSDPNRIVIDFRSSKEFPAVEKKLGAAPFVSASVGTHDTFIRASIVLDGRYRYTLSRDGKTITIQCR